MDTILSHVRYTTVPGFPDVATAVKLAFGSPRDEEVLYGYIECDLLNITSPGLGLIV